MNMNERCFQDSSSAKTNIGTNEQRILGQSSHNYLKYS